MATKKDNKKEDTTPAVELISTGVDSTCEAIKSDELDATNNIGIITKSANANGAQGTSRDVKPDELSTVGDIGGFIAEIFTSTNVDGVFITSDNTFFTVKCNAINHAKTLYDQKVRTFSRRIWKMLAKI